ncbi:hypothetical protein RND81_05G028000 [Saponaria officinalis]|uniref:Uncharacterized protein n=1 Tax=Saponaria officinalis TaxID=3572 RepID=A0AAW1KWT4_SAPOF
MPSRQTMPINLKPSVVSTRCMLLHFSLCNRLRYKILKNYHTRSSDFDKVEPLIITMTKERRVHSKQTPGRDNLLRLIVLIYRSTNHAYNFVRRPYSCRLHLHSNIAALAPTLFDELYPRWLSLT